MKRLISFFCEWFSYPGLQLSHLPAEKIEKGFDKHMPGTYIDGVNPGCLERRNYKAVRRIALLKNLLEQFGIEPERLKLVHVSKGDVKTFKSVVEEFEKEMEKLDRCLKV